MDLKEEDILGDKIYEHWYYISKGKAMRDMIGDQHVDEVLDVGAGSGIFSRQLLDHNIAKSAVCVDPNYAEETQDTQNGKPISFVKSIDKTTQDLVLMMDVLEHVPDDVALLKEYADSMKQGGRILITVPAFQFLWSGHDVFLEHYRRYTIKMMEKAIEDAGLTPVKSRYFFGSLFPAVVAIRFIKKVLIKSRNIQPQSELKLYPRWINRLLIHLHGIEQHSIFKINKAFGLSVFCICEKK